MSHLYLDIEAKSSRSHIVYSNKRAITSIFKTLDTEARRVEGVKSYIFGKMAFFERDRYQGPKNKLKVALE